MNILDENIPEDQRRLLSNRRVPFHHISSDIGREGMKDEEIIPLLHQLQRPTFFTFDFDFYKPRLRHARYCLVLLSVEQSQAADTMRRFLRHREFDTQAKRMGSVVHVSPSGITAWRHHAEQEMSFTWD